jgi:hypothetical protein
VAGHARFGRISIYFSHSKHGQHPESNSNSVFDSRNGTKQDHIVKQLIMSRPLVPRHFVGTDAGGCGSEIVERV